MKEMDMAMVAARRRKKQMLAQRNLGWSDAKIGKYHGGISYQRVGQILGPKKSRKP